MENKKYRLRYLPLFEQDLLQTVRYIANVLKNPDSAFNLADDVMEVRRFLYRARDAEKYL